MLDTITGMHKQTQITLIRPQPSYKQLEVKEEPNIVFMRKSDTQRRRYLECFSLLNILEKRFVEHLDEPAI